LIAKEANALASGGGGAPSAPLGALAPNRHAVRRPRRDAAAAEALRCLWGKEATVPVVAGSVEI